MPASQLPKYRIGTPVTYCIGSDRYAGKLKEFRRNGRTAVVSLDRGSEMEFTLRADGSYMKKGARNYGYLLWGYAENYRDPHI